MQKDQAMKRRLRFASESHAPLLQANHRHLFAQQHALRLYRQRAVYSFIPKNACSTMRYTLAVENGCITDEKDFNWIHANNGTFTADLDALLTAEFTFVFLRCPFARIASAYLDKLVNRDRQLWDLQAHMQYSFKPEDLTFSQFVRMLRSLPALKLDIHWRPQIDFLVYQEYDAYYRLEEFAVAQTDLKKRLDIDVLDARHLTRHGTDQYELLDDQCHANTGPFRILGMKRNGQCPSPKSLFDEQCVDIVRTAYAEDIALYRSFFGDDGLMFS